MLRDAIAVARVATQVAQMQFQPFVGDMRDQKWQQVTQQKDPTRQPTPPRGCLVNVLLRRMLLCDNGVHGVRVDCEIAVYAVKIIRP